MLRPPHPEAREGALRVEGRGHSGTARGGRPRVARPLGVVAAAVACAVAVAVASGKLPEGLVVLGDEQLPTRELVQEVATDGVAIHRFTGSAGLTSW